jgi:hypothetical protein
MRHDDFLDDGQILHAHAQFCKVTEEGPAKSSFDQKAAQAATYNVTDKDEGAPHDDPNGAIHAEADAEYEGGAHYEEYENDDEGEAYNDDGTAAAHDNDEVANCTRRC